MKRNQQQKKTVNNATVWLMLTSLLMGLFFLFFFISKNDTTNLTLFFTAFSIILSLTLITDFTNVLLDVRDNFIILPKPVNDKTFVLAKLLHIIMHISKMVVPLSIPTLVFIAIAKGIWGVLILLPLIVLVTLFTVFAINAFYLLILKITTPEKFKTIISYVQIVFAVGIYASSQILPRAMANSLQGMDLAHYKLINLLPTYWFGNSWNALYTLNFSSANIVTLLLAVFVPIICIWLIIKYFAPSFNQKLSQISGSSTEGSNTSSSLQKTNTKNKYSNWWAQKITTTSTEKMGFLFTWKMMMRSRDFKVKVYPGIGYMIVILFISTYGKIDFKNLLTTVHTNEKAIKMLVLITIYFSILMITTALGGIVMSDKYKAAWMYFITPIYKPGQILAGAIKAVTVMFFVPFAILALCFGIGLIGINVLPNLLLAISNQLLIITLMAMVSVNYLPFSITSYKPNALGMIKNIGMMLVAGIIGALHYYIYEQTIVVIVLIIGSLTATYFLFKSIADYNWGKILSEYKED